MKVYREGSTRFVAVSPRASLSEHLATEPAMAPPSPALPYLGHREGRRAPTTSSTKRPTRAGRLRCRWHKAPAALLPHYRIDPSPCQNLWITSERMAEQTRIEWVDHTFNPWIGCTRVSPACDNCYAAAMSHRRKWARFEPRAPRRSDVESPTGSSRCAGIARPRRPAGAPRCSGRAWPIRSMPRSRRTGARTICA